MSPVLPSELEAVIVLPTDTMAVAIVKTYVRLPVLVYRFLSWALLSDGTPSGEFENWICEGCNRLREIDEMETT